MFVATKIGLDKQKKKIEKAVYAKANARIILHLWLIVLLLQGHRHKAVATASTNRTFIHTTLLLFQNPSALRAASLPKWAFLSLRALNFYVRVSG